ncbi:MAG: tRNA 4-thiouridine(8) synthase ThiI [archaeon GB-1845-036]|nr:tRNA 4-thiouridine(8) synthase ThiI [Candidatus Culexmicrobium thermophilum]
MAAYGEIAIKSNIVRRRFVKRLMNNIIEGLSRTGKVKVIHKWSRILIDVEDIPRAVDVLSKIFGIVYFAPYKFVNLNSLEDFIRDNCSSLLEDAESFAVRVRRKGKHAFTSRDLEAKLGKIVKENLDLNVSLENPDKTLYVEIKGNDCYIYNSRIQGPGGLPLGTAGRVVSLISGGIDSPVAAWMLMKRGCTIIPLFAYFPKNDDSMLKRFLKVISILKEWHVGFELPIYLFRHEHNLEVFMNSAPKYTCILCKRMMYRVANFLAEKVNADAIATGENLAQVASQTLKNLRVIDQASRLPVLRPLIGFDKDETVALARKIGTFTASSMNIGECWAKPSKPVTRAKFSEIIKIEEKLNVDKLLEESVRSLTRIM